MILWIYGFEGRIYGKQYSVIGPYYLTTSFENMYIYVDVLYNILKYIIRFKIITNKIREWEIAIIAKRKILTAILSSLLFALIFSTFGGFEVNGFFNLYYLNFIIVITYGVSASFFSDWLSRKIANGDYTREITSFLLHCGCGAILQVLGLSSAILFFIIDRLLEKVKIGWLSVIIALSIVGLVFVFLINS